MPEDEIIGWHHQLNWHEFEQTLRDSEGQGGLLCCSLWSHSVRQNLWDSPGKNTGVGCHSLLQGIFLTQGSNLGLPHCRKIQV